MRTTRVGSQTGIRIIERPCAGLPTAEREGLLSLFGSGKTTKRDLCRRLGPPDRAELVADEEVWTYETGAHVLRVVFDAAGNGTMTTLRGSGS
jgi:hypothetical protein